jgi:hypothetical protein
VGAPGVSIDSVPSVVATPHVVLSPHYRRIRQPGHDFVDNAAAGLLPNYRKFDPAGGLATCVGAEEKQTREIRDNDSAN